MKQKQELFLVITLLFGIFILLAIFDFLSEGIPFGAENPTHYFISRYAFDRPWNFLSPWGRPLYTVITAPFAQFGMIGIKLLNSFLGVMTAYFAYLIAKKLEIRPSFLVIIFVCFTHCIF